MSYKSNELIQICLIILIHFVLTGLLSLFISLNYFGLFIIVYPVVNPFPIAIILIYFHIYFRKYIENFNFIISENEIIMKRGVYKKKSISIPYAEIQRLDISSGFIERKKQIYTLKIETSQDNIIIFKLILSLIIIIVCLLIIFLKELAYKLAVGYYIMHFSLLPLLLVLGLIKSDKCIPGLKEPEIIEQMIKEKMKNYTRINTNINNHILKSEDLAFDNFISYLLSRIEEANDLKSSLRQIREKRGLSLSDLAKKINVPIRTIKYLEEGKFSPSLFLTYKIAEVLNCKIEELFSL
ncbi:MAG: helix-turn-helix domain-containing protein [Candidatus Lokiarchaeota archaeon]|nr:helix-turn-helix domain-containing protein [Candidatus Lokiarchaeota archaeon]